MAATSLSGTDVQLYINAGEYTDNIWKVAVCAIQHTLSEAKTESTIITKCGSQTTPGTDDNSISLDLTFLSSVPASTELDAETLIEIYRAGVTFDWIIADVYPDAVHICDLGAGVATSCTSSYPAEGMVNVAFEIKCNGSITGQYLMD